MNMQVDKKKCALAFGLLIAFVHLVWSLMVAFGLAQMYLNFIFGLHMLSMPIVVMPFSILKTIGLVLVTFVAGYLFGWFMAFFWNKCFKETVSQK